MRQVRCVGAQHPEPGDSDANLGLLLAGSAKAVPMARNATRLSVCAITLLLLGTVWSQAAGAAIYEVPPEIADDCTAPVEDEILAWLATVPDGNTARFAPGRCYGQDGSIVLNARSNLTIEGQGSEFRTLTAGQSHRSNWRFVGGADLTVQNMAVRGSNPAGGYTAGFEWQHGFSVEGVQGLTLSDVQARETWGDGVYLDHSTQSPTCGDDASSARNVQITDATLERIGRQGIAVVDAENVTVQDSVIGPVALANIDLETDDDCALARHITIRRNQFGAHTWGVIDSVGFGADPQVGDVTVTDNTETVAAPGCFAPVRILSPGVAEGQPRVYRSGYTFGRNRFLGTRNGFEFRGLRNVEVSLNDVALPPTVGCGTRAGVLLVDSHTVSITSNAFIDANSILRADSLSTGIVAEGNWTVDSVAPLISLDQPASGSTTTDVTPVLSGTAGSQPGDSQTVTVKVWSGSAASGSPLQTKTTSRDRVTGAYSLATDTLTDGTYTVLAEQSDAAGNSAQSNPSTFTVEATAPNADQPASRSASGPLVAAGFTPLPDVEPPVVELGGRRTQKARGIVTVKVTARSENLWATASGKVVIRGSQKVYKLKGVKAKFVALGQTATLKLELSRNTLTSIRRALRRLPNVRAKLRLSLRDAAGNASTRARTIRLER
jgi:hypothetical protein